jgi:hypothetical protein
MTEAHVLARPARSEVLATSAETVTEQLFEIRYTPNPRVLDFRGTWAQALSDHLALPEWEIDQNRIDIFNQDRSRRGFVSFRNCGFYVRNSPTVDFFPDQGVKLVRFMMSDDTFGDRLFVKRFGLRTRVATPFAGPFEALVARYSNRVARLNPEAARVFDAEVIDVGAPVNFKTKLGTLNTVSGPMDRKQLQKFFPQADELPEVSLYLDLDYWLEPKKTFAIRDITSLIKRFAEENWNIQSRFATLVLGH